MLTVTRICDRLTVGSVVGGDHALVRGRTAAGDWSWRLVFTRVARPTQSLVLPRITANTPHSVHPHHQLTSVQQR